MIKWTEYANADSFSASLGGQNQLVGYTEKNNQSNNLWSGYSSFSELPLQNILTMH